MNDSNKISLFGMTIDAVNLQQATDRVLNWCREPRAEVCRYIVTPNVDHAVMYQERPELRAAYESAAMVVADGAPLIAAARFLKRPLPERVAGSDLVPLVLQNAGGFEQPKLKAFLLGAGPGVAERAAAKILKDCGGVEIVGTHCPPLGFEHDTKAEDAALAAVAQAAPDFLIVGLGAPKQELWVAKNRHRLEAKVAACAGATIDFLAGEKHRSPVWMQKSGLEWAHRLATEPRRLVGRYARDARIFPGLVWREWRGGFAR